MIEYVIKQIIINTEQDAYYLNFNNGKIKILYHKKKNQLIQNIYRSLIIGKMLLIR